MSDAWELLVAGSAIEEGDAWDHLYHLEVKPAVVKDLEGVVISPVTLIGVVESIILTGEII